MTPFWIALPRQLAAPPLPRSPQRPHARRPRRAVHGRVPGLVWAGLAVVLSVGGARLSAQEPDGNDPNLIAKSEQEFDAKMNVAAQQGLADTLAVSPAVVQLEAASRTVSVTLKNVGGDTLVVDWVRLQAGPSPARQGPGANPLLAPAGAPAAAAAAPDSLRPVGSLVAWITGVPEKKPIPPAKTTELFSLGPNATQTLTLQIRVPQRLKPGAYTGYLVLRTHAFITFALATLGERFLEQYGPMHCCEADAGGRYPYTVVPVVYRAP